MSHEIIIIDNIVIDVEHESLTVTKKGGCSLWNVFAACRILWRYLRP